MNEADKKKLEKLHKCNLKDFLQTFSDPKYRKNNSRWFGDMVDYIARYNMEGVKNECNFATLVQTARNLALSQFAEYHLDELDNTEYDYMGQMGVIDRIKMKHFIEDPFGVIKDELMNYQMDKNLHNRYSGITKDNEKEFTAYYKKLEDNAHTIGKQISLGSIIENDKNVDTTIETLSRVIKRLPEGINTIDEALEGHKGGFLERTFNTSSQEYKNFKTALKDFRNPKSVYLGDLNHLEKETRGYLKHVMPGFKDTDPLPTPEQLAALKGTQKGRAEFCVNVLKSINETKEILPVKDKVERAIGGEHIERNGAVIIQKGGDGFQQQLKADLDDFVGLEEMFDEEKINEPKPELSPEEKEEYEENEELFDELTNINN